MTFRYFANRHTGNRRTFLVVLTKMPPQGFCWVHPITLLHPAGVDMTNEVKGHLGQNLLPFFSSAADISAELSAQLLTFLWCKRRFTVQTIEPGSQRTPSPFSSNLEELFEIVKTDCADVFLPYFSTKSGDSMKELLYSAPKAAFSSKPVFQAAHAPSFGWHPHERVLALAAVWKSAGLSAELLLVRRSRSGWTNPAARRVGGGGRAAPAAFNP